MTNEGYNKQDNEPDPIVAKLRQERRKKTEEGLFDKLPITQNAFEKVNQYSRVLKYLLGKDLECMGYLIAPAEKTDGVIYDAVYSLDQEMREGGGRGRSLKTMDEIHRKGYKVLGFWHGHGKHDVNPTDIDENLIEFFSASGLIEIEVDSEKIEHIVEQKDGKTLLTIPVPESPRRKIEVMLDREDVSAEIVYKKSKEIAYWYAIIINNRGKHYAEIDYVGWDENKKSYTQTKSNKDIGLEFTEEGPAYDLATLVDEVFERTVYEDEKNVCVRIKDLENVKDRYGKLKYYFDKNIELSEIFEQVMIDSLHANADDADKELMDILRHYPSFKTFAQIKKESGELKNSLSRLGGLFSEGIDADKIQTLIKQESELERLAKYTSHDDARLEPIIKNYESLKEKLKVLVSKKKKELSSTLESELIGLADQSKRLIEESLDTDMFELVNQLRALADKCLLLKEQEKADACERLIKEISSNKEQYEERIRLSKDLRTVYKELEEVLETINSIQIKDTTEAISPFIAIKSRFGKVQSKYDALDEDSVDPRVKQLYGLVEKAVAKKEKTILTKITAEVDKVRERYAGLGKEDKSEESVRGLLGDLREPKELLAKLGCSTEEVFGTFEDVLTYDLKSFELDKESENLTERIELLRSVNLDDTKTAELFVQYLNLKNQSKGKEPTSVDYEDAQLNAKSKKVKELRSKESEMLLKLEDRVNAAINISERRLTILTNNLDYLGRQYDRGRAMLKGASFVEKVVAIEEELKIMEQKYGIFERHFKRITLDKNRLSTTRQKVSSALENERGLVKKNIPRNPTGKQLFDTFAKKLDLQYNPAKSMIVITYLKKIGLINEAELIEKGEN